MANVNDFKGIPSVTWGFLVLFIIGAVLPGVLLVYLFQQELFLEIETIKLLFLSMSITLPVWVFNTFLYGMFRENYGVPTVGEDEMREELQLLGMTGAAFSAPIFYIPSLVKMITDISTNTAFFVAFGIEAVLLFAMVLPKITGRRKVG